jgi:putative endopeptidase
MDPSVRPQDDLFLAMNGAWVKKTEIPADKASWGTFYQLRELSDQRVKDIIEDLATRQQAAGTVNAKIGDYYKSYMDTAAIDAAGTKPLEEYKTQLAAVRNKKDLVALMGHWISFVDVPLNMGIGPDSKDPTIYSAGTFQGGLGLGDRDYYLKNDPRFVKNRADYVTYVRTLLTLDGDKNAVMHAKAVMALEMKMARVQWSQEANRDPVKTYNPMPVKDIAAKAPGIDWRSFLAAADLTDPPFVSITQPSYTWALAKLVKDQPIDVWKAYMRVRLLDATARELPTGFRDAAYKFHDVAITGVTQD